ncbi:hypothetical protein ACFL5L_00645 [candidate division KSB1 bacterium]
MVISCKKILSYPISRLENTVNGISITILSGLWLTGVTIGLVEKSAAKIKKSIIGPIERPKPSVVIKPTEEKNQVFLNLFEDTRSVEEELTKLEQAVAKIKERVQGGKECSLTSF